MLGNLRRFIVQLSARSTVDMSESKTLTAKAVPQANGWKKTYFELYERITIVLLAIVQGIITWVR